MSYNFSVSKVDYHICLETTTEKISLEIEQALLLSPEKNGKQTVPNRKSTLKSSVHSFRRPRRLSTINIYDFKLTLGDKDQLDDTKKRNKITSFSIIPSSYTVTYISFKGFFTF